MHTGAGALCPGTFKYKKVFFKKQGKNHSVEAVRTHEIREFDQRQKVRYGNIKQPCIAEFGIAFAVFSQKVRQRYDLQALFFCKVCCQLALPGVVPEEIAEQVRVFDFSRRSHRFPFGGGQQHGRVEDLYRGGRRHAGKQPNGVRFAHGDRLIIPQRLAEHLQLCFIQIRFGNTRGIRELGLLCTVDEGQKVGGANRIRVPDLVAAGDKDVVLRHALRDIRSVIDFRAVRDAFGVKL